MIIIFCYIIIILLYYIDKSLKLEFIYKVEMSLFSTEELLWLKLSLRISLPARLPACSMKSLLIFSKK